jgi:N-acetylglutamate synthase-like GNAT family acetyltransferase
MPTTDLHRIAEFRGSFARRQAAATTEIPGGAVVLDPRFAASYVNNQIVMDGARTPSDLLALAETTLGSLPHRRISFLDDAAGTAWLPTLIAAGYTHETELIMSHSPSGSGKASAPGLPARQVTLDELRPALIKQQRVWTPDGDDAMVGQLVDRRSARLLGAPRVSFLAVRDENGDIGSSVDLYRDPDRGIAQIEELVTADTHTRRGYADALLATAVERAADCDLLFLIADADDWPHTWYARRGFTTIGRSHVFTRAPSRPGHRP